MAKLITTIIFSLITLYSSVASVAVELHLIDHNHQHLDHHKHSGHSVDHDHNEAESSHHATNLEEELIEHLFFHAQHDQTPGHGHEGQEEQFLSHVNEKSLKLMGPYIVPSFLHLSFLMQLRAIGDVNESPPAITISYSPPPEQFRNLPLLN